MKTKSSFSFLEFIISTAISLVVGGLLFVLFYFLRGGGLIGACDSALITGVIVTGSAGLIFVGREGFFDIFAYGFMQLGTMIFAKKANVKHDYPTYKEDLTKKRANGAKYHLYILIVGLLFVTAFIVLRLILSYYI